MFYNARFHELFIKQSQPLDVAERRRLVHEMEMIAHEHMAAIVPCWGSLYYAQMVDVRLDEVWLAK